MILDVALKSLGYAVCPQRPAVAPGQRHFWLGPAQVVVMYEANIVAMLEGVLLLGVRGWRRQQPHGHVALDIQICKSPVCAEKNLLCVCIVCVYPPPSKWHVFTHFQAKHDDTGRFYREMLGRRSRQGVSVQIERGEGGVGVEEGGEFFTGPVINLVVLEVQDPQGGVLLQPVRQGLPPPGPNAVGCHVEACDGGHVLEQ